MIPKFSGIDGKVLKVYQKKPLEKSGTILTMFLKPFVESRIDMPTNGRTVLLIKLLITVSFLNFVKLYCNKSGNKKWSSPCKSQSIVGGRLYNLTILICSSRPRLYRFVLLDHRKWQYCNVIQVSVLSE